MSALGERESFKSSRGRFNSMKLLNLLHREAPGLDAVLRNRLTMAKVIQEDAITERIRSAEEVKILECICKANNEDFGLRAGERNLIAGTSESNNLVLKRVIIFKGRVSNVQ
jgi:hypothetical protein